MKHVLIHTMAWMTHENMMLNGKKKKKTVTKVTYGLIPFIGNIQNR